MNQSFKIGNIFGIACAVSILIEFYSGFQDSQYILASGFVALALKFTGILLAIRFTKKKEFGGIIDFRQALRAGMSATFIISVLYGLFMLLFIQYINPNFIDHYIIEVERTLRMNSYSEQDIQIHVDQLKEVKGSGSQGWLAFSNTLIFGTILSLVLAYFIRTKVSFPDSNNSN